MDAMTLRNGIYAMHTRRLGSVAEMLVQRLCKTWQRQTHPARSFRRYAKAQSRS